MGGLKRRGIIQWHGVLLHTATWVVEENCNPQRLPHVLSAHRVHAPRAVLLVIFILLLSPSRTHTHLLFLLSLLTYAIQFLFYRLYRTHIKQFFLFLLFFLFPHNFYAIIFPCTLASYPPICHTACYTQQPLVAPIFLFTI